jgi:hypothetical protein
MLLRTSLSLLVALLLAVPAVAQDTAVTDTTKADSVAPVAVCTINVLAKKANWAPDTAVTDTTIPTTVYMAQNGTATLTATAGTECRVTDSDGRDGEAAATVPYAEYEAVAKLIGKKGSVTIGDVVLSATKAKGKKPKLQAVPLAGTSWSITNAGAQGVQIRLLPIAPEPAVE